MRLREGLLAALWAAFLLVLLALILLALSAPGL